MNYLRKVINVLFSLCTIPLLFNFTREIVIVMAALSLLNIALQGLSFKLDFFHVLFVLYILASLFMDILIHKSIYGIEISILYVLYFGIYFNSSKIHICDKEKYVNNILLFSFLSLLVLIDVNIFFPEFRSYFLSLNTNYNNAILLILCP